jgi:hypothetical protein
MNKTAAFISFAALAAVGLIGSVVLAIHRPDATATFTGLIVTVLGLAASAAGTFYALGKQGEKIDAVAKNVNGNSTRMLDTIETQQQQIHALLSALPAVGATSPVDTTPPMSEDTILRLREDVATLPSHRAE